MLMLPLSCLVGIVIPVSLCLLSLTLEKATSEEHVKYFLWVYALLKVPLMKTASSVTWWLLVAGILTCLVVNPSFLFVGKTSVGRTYFFECL